MYKSLYIADTRFTSVRQSNKAIAKTAPDIVLVDKTERTHTPELEALFKLDALLALQVTANEIKTAINELYI